MSEEREELVLVFVMGAILGAIAARVPPEFAAIIFIAGLAVMLIHDSAHKS